MMLRAEFTTEPFEGEGDPPAHALAARDCLLAAGLDPDFGPLGTAISGDRDQLLPALAEVLDKALAAGANRITLQVTAEDDRV
ncbi:thiamine-binding protein [Saccharopolyspora endophytica]|uniref:Thiamine-binding protein n=1 Tax=Saccharopolyspora endophytica TaxID=543886 RepID=A0ABS5D9I6_9PSEU|nr:thiamine-binding protein [Saccharopolyspora endophytica]MBQ0922951.1 thiamine-binding protein [Saccharopolyspora endophytica]